MYRFIGYGYPHPAAFNPFMLNPAWLDAAYMTYGYADYFRHQAVAAAAVHHPVGLSKTSPTLTPTTNCGPRPLPPSVPSNSVTGEYPHSSQITPPPPSLGTLSGPPLTPSSSILPSPPNTVYNMPQFPFNPVAAAAAAAAASAHPDVMHPHQKIHQHAFHPYNFAGGLRSRVPPLHNAAMTNQLPGGEHISPASSRPSSSSPSSTHQATNQKLLIESSIDSNSAHDPSGSDVESDEETIDVVKSAFVPILRPPTSICPSVISSCDDLEKSVDSIRSSPTTQTQQPVRTRCELKAPSALKPLYHESQSAHLLSNSSSPDSITSNNNNNISTETNLIATKIKNTSVQKTVWRPY